jgi:hypothetical protein
MLLEEHKRVLHLQHLLNDPQDYSTNYPPASEIFDGSQTPEIWTGQTDPDQIGEP